MNENKIISNLTTRQGAVRSRPFPFFPLLSSLFPVPCSLRKRESGHAGFTLLEVNLAIFVMATGTLAMCALYSLGFRESSQSVEDVAAASFADAYLAPLVQGLSATNLAWTTWLEIGDTPANSETKKVADALWPSDGWMSYVQKPKDNNAFNYRIKGTPRTTADGVFGQVKAKLPSPYAGNNPGIPSGFQYGLVVTRNGTTVQLAFRIAKRRESLMSQPLIVSEVRFQGDPDR